MGNVLVTISDKRLPVLNSSGNLSHYDVEVVTTSDYYPFGMQMPGRSYDAGSGYRYGYNGQEKSTEIGETYTAEYWEYDPRSGRRWNMDPKGKVYESPFSCFSNNPLVFSDPLGDTTQLFTSDNKYMGTDYRGKGQFVYISDKENDKQLQAWHDNNFKDVNRKSENEFQGMLKNSGSIYDINSVKDYYTTYNGKGKITKIQGTPLENLRNITINARSATLKMLLLRLKNEGIGPERQADLTQNKYGIYIVTPTNDLANDPQNAQTGKRIIHTHPNSKKILIITYDNYVKGHKINEYLITFEIRPYSPVDDEDMRQAGRFGLHNSVRNIVVEKNYIFFYNADTFLDIKK